MHQQPDRVLAAVGEALALAGGGRRGAARALLGELWDEVGADGDALHRCSIAHTMADLQDDPAQELAWDLRALDAATEVDEARLTAAGMVGTTAALLPSLHLNLADVYVRLGHVDRARAHVRSGRAALGALPDDGYRDMIAGGLARVALAAGLGDEAE